MLRLDQEGASQSDEPTRARQMPPWPHPELASQPSMSTLRSLLAIEPNRILSFLGEDDLEAEGEELLRATMHMRELSAGMRLTAASAWFSYRPDRYEVLADQFPSLPVSSTSSSDPPESLTASQQANHHLA